MVVDFLHGPKLGQSITKKRPLNSKPPENPLQIPQVGPLARIPYIN
jgi:hypothetical protein